MTVSVVGICNMGLAMIGDDANSITSLSDTTKAARLCNLFYEPLRDAVLRSHNWNFATKRETLAALSDVPTYGFAKAFALPDDFIKMWETEEEELFGITGTPYRIEGIVGTTKRTLCTDDATCNITYIYKVTDPNAFDPMFVQVLAARIAATLSMPLTENANIAEKREAAYIKLLSEAKSIDAQEGTPRGLDADAWTNARI
jgi:hypothetical protein